MCHTSGRRRPAWSSRSALIPEAISFSIIAGVDLRIDLFDSFTMAIKSAIVGGRPAMISAATARLPWSWRPLRARARRRPPGRHRRPRRDLPDRPRSARRGPADALRAAQRDGRSNDLVSQSDYADNPDNVTIDLTDAHVWDASTVAALEAITTKYQRHGNTVEILGLNEHSARMHDTLTSELAANH